MGLDPGGVGGGVGGDVGEDAEAEGQPLRVLPLRLPVSAPPSPSPDVKRRGREALHFLDEEVEEVLGPALAQEDTLVIREHLKETVSLPAVSGAGRREAGLTCRRRRVCRSGLGPDWALRERRRKS